VLEFNSGSSCSESNSEVGPDSFDDPDFELEMAEEDSEFEADSELEETDSVFELEQAEEVENSGESEVNNDEIENDDRNDAVVGIAEKQKVAVACKRVYDKPNWCCYCSKKLSSKISRHLTTHKLEEVTAIRLLPERCEEQMARLKTLANEGNFRHNTSALAAGKGELVVERRAANAKLNGAKYLPCESCY
jgi:hypothetical protein